MSMTIVVMVAVLIVFEETDQSQWGMHDGRLGIGYFMLAGSA